MKAYSLDDTIVALATAPGTGAIAVIRLSGSEAIRIAEDTFRSPGGRNKKLSNVRTHSLHFGKIFDGEKPIDEVLLAVMKAPNSYTGEDVVEVSCHGSVYIQQALLKLFGSRGARQAGPGEFTLRAFLNGKLDLAQAEAVAELIAADSAASHGLALRQMRGGFSEEINALRKQLIHFASLIELELDFSEEDVEFASRNDLMDVIDKLSLAINSLVESFELGNVIRKGIPVVIAGKPNAGKSTLLNALLNDERAIVSDQPGTTRDTIEEEVVIDGIKFRFIDTAGLRDTQDAIESIGVTKAFEKMNESPVVIYLFDASETTETELKSLLEQLRQQVSATVRIIPVGNKADLPSVAEHIDKGGDSHLLISAKEGRNIDELKQVLKSLFGDGKIGTDQSILTSARHAEALTKTSLALSHARQGLKDGVSSDFIAADLRQALNHLGSITGEISTDDLLENIFSKFCIGK